MPPPFNVLLDPLHTLQDIFIGVRKTDAQLALAHLTKGGARNGHHAGVHQQFLRELPGGDSKVLDVNEGTELSLIHICPGSVVGAI